MDLGLPVLLTRGSRDVRTRLTASGRRECVIGAGLKERCY